MFIPKYKESELQRNIQVQLWTVPKRKPVWRGKPAPIFPDSSANSQQPSWNLDLWFPKSCRTIKEINWVRHSEGAFQPRSAKQYWEWCLSTKYLKKSRDLMEPTKVSPRLPSIQKHPHYPISSMRSRMAASILVTLSGICDAPKGPLKGALRAVETPGSWHSWDPGSFHKEFHPTGGVKATNYTNTEPEWGKAFFPDAVSGKCTGHT